MSTRQIGDVMLDVANISLAFGGVKALTDISFNVREHEIRAIIGPNGAGKSSMLNCINGVYQPQQGAITFRGQTFTHFRCDPEDPVPTTGGPTFMAAAGQRDQSSVEARPDVALFTTAPLKQDTEVVGEVRARLFVRSSEPDTDFTAKLVAAPPDSHPVNIADGVRRLRTYRSYERPRPVTPGRVVPLEIDLGATDTVFPAGWRIRLEVSSSNFPRFDRNPNTGAPFGTGTELRPADNEVLHGEPESSALLLPIRGRARQG